MLKLQQTWGGKALWLFQSDDSDRRAPSLAGEKNLRQQSDAGSLRRSEGDDNSVLSRPAVAFSSDWTEQNLHLITLHTGVTAGPNYITPLFQKSRHRF